MTVAAAPTVPGTPNSTAGIKSDVVVTAATPSSSANDVGASRLYVNGISTASATTPPNPGMQPIARPISTPSTRIIRRVGSMSNCSAWSAISNWPGIGRDSPPSPARCALRAAPSHVYLRCANGPTATQKRERRRASRGRRVLYLIEPVESHRFDDAVADHDQARFVLARAEML